MLLLGLLVFLITAPGWVMRLDIWPEPRPAAVASESRRVGWHDSAAFSDISHDIFERVNDERRARGLPPLVWHEGLATLARAWSERMVESGHYEHSPERFRAHPDFIGTGENIATGYRGADGVHVGWMRSDGHRQNILNPSYTAIGVGVVCRGDGQMWATQIFGVPIGSTVPNAQVDTGVDPIVRREQGPRCPQPNPLLPEG